MTPVLVLTTVGATFDPAPLATLLVEKQLAACVNVIPQIYSVYRWKGAIERESEQLLLIKTVDTRVDELRKALFSMHPYEVPEFVVVTIDKLSDAYRSWLVGELHRAE
ncbi:MAG TPA: divalent-cation tolerance protein CutA [Thermoanaerobaculia bacterium]